MPKLALFAFALLGLLGLTNDSVGATPKTSAPSPASLATAAKSPCWTGATKLVASSPKAHSGELVTLRTAGTDARYLTGGSNFTTFERPTPQGFAVTYYLSSPGGTSRSYAIIPFSPNVVGAGVGLTGPATVRIPDVPPGTYRFVRFYRSVLQGSGGAVGGYPKEGVNLCVSVRVLAAAPASTASNDVGATVSPSTSLHDGEQVTVSLRGFGVGGKVWLSECAFVDDMNEGGCGAALPEQSETAVSSNGAATTTFIVHDHAAASPNRREPTYLCATNCVLVASLGVGFADVSVPLQFAQPAAAVGSFDVEGGAAPGTPRRVPGTVTFRSATGRTYATTTTSSGEFSLALSPGTYETTGQSPQVRANGAEALCRDPSPVQVAATETATVEVVCEVK